MELMQSADPMQKLWKMGEDPGSKNSPTFAQHEQMMKKLQKQADQALKEPEEEKGDHMWRQAAKWSHQADTLDKERRNNIKKAMEESLQLHLQKDDQDDEDDQDEEDQDEDDQDELLYGDEDEDDEELVQVLEKPQAAIEQTIRENFVAAGLLATTAKPKVVVKKAAAGKAAAKKAVKKATKAAKAAKKGMAKAAKKAAKKGAKALNKKKVPAKVEVKQLRAKLAKVQARDAKKAADEKAARKKANNAKAIKAKAKQIVVTKDHVVVPTPAQEKKLIKSDIPPAIHRDPLYWKLRKLREEYHLKSNYRKLKRQMLEKYLSRHYGSRLIKDHMRRTINRLRRERAIQRYGPGAHYTPFTWGEFDRDGVPPSGGSVGSKTKQKDADAKAEAADQQKESEEHSDMSKIRRP